MERKCTNCKYKSLGVSEQPCKSCVVEGYTKFTPKNESKIECEYIIEEVSMEHSRFTLPTIKFEGVGYIKNYSGGLCSNDIRKDLESKLNKRDDSVDAYTYTINSDVIKSYCEHDVKVNVNEMYPKLTQLAYQSYYGAHGQYGPKLTIKKVIFNDPATVVMWTDGTKTVVKAQDEEFDPEKGLAMAITKKALGNQGNYFDEIKKWTEPYYEKEAKEEAEKKPEFSLLDFLINPEKGFTITFASDDKEITLNDVVMSKKDAE